jgi:HNH endonuclease
MTLEFILLAMSREYVPAELRRLVFDRGKGYCEYCRSSGRFALDSMEIDHIIPVSRGGETVLDNLASACHGCNNYKRNRINGYDPVSSDLAVLYHPRAMIWSDHFAWSQDTRLIFGLTSIGRVTVALLHLNREGVVNLREILRGSGQHPPD